MNTEKIEVLMMAGGVGDRTKEITGKSIPKSFLNLKNEFRAIDYITEQLEKIGLTATWSADYYYYQYQEVLKGTNHRMLWQKPGGTTEMIYQPGGTVLAVAPDCIFPYRDLPAMIAQHLPGTITWAITRHNFSDMDEYRGMDVLPSGAIVGRGDKNITRAPVMIVDNELLKHYHAPNSHNAKRDIFYDVMPRVEYDNSLLIKTGKSSILNAFFLSGPVVDFGTPARYFNLVENFGTITNGR